MNKKGFTLIELLATIVIIGLIMAIILPAATKLRDENHDEIYHKYEDMLEEYAAINPKNEDYYINLNDLDDLWEVKEKCVGYVLINHDVYPPVYTGYVKCPDYTTPDYDEYEMKFIPDLKCENIVYDGTSHSLVQEDTNAIVRYTLKNNKRTEYGEQNVIASITDKTKFSWSDNSQDDKIIRHCSVKKKSIVVTGKQQSKTYNKVALKADNTCTADSLPAEHVVECSGNTGSRIDVGTGDKNVGTVIVKKNGVDVTKNFNITKKTGKLVVKVRKLTPTVTATNKVYDGTTTATCGGTATLTTVMSGDSVIATVNTSGTFSDENVGTGKTVTCDGITLSGSSIANYVLSSTSATTTANITPLQCNTPTNLTITSEGKITWTPSSNCLTAQHLLKIGNGSYSTATSGVNKKNDIIATTGSRAVYVKAMAPNSNYLDSMETTKSIDVYQVNLTRGAGISSVTGAGNYIRDSKPTIDATINNGYEWSRWTGTPATTTKNYSAAIVKNWNVTANANPISYSITYILNGGSVSNVTSYNIETSTFTLSNPTRSNYSFIGWTGSNGSTPQMNVTINKGSTGDRSYTANWKKK